MSMKYRIYFVNIRKESVIPPILAIGVGLPHLLAQYEIIARLIFDMPYLFSTLRNSDAWNQKKLIKNTHDVQHLNMGFRQP